MPPEPEPYDENIITRIIQAIISAMITVYTMLKARIRSIMLVVTITSWIHILLWDFEVFGVYPPDFAGSIILSYDTMYFGFIPARDVLSFTYFMSFPLKHAYAASAEKNVNLILLLLC